MRTSPLRAKSRIQFGGVGGLLIYITFTPEADDVGIMINGLAVRIGECSELELSIGNTSARNQMISPQLAASFM
jgi:hypothetical protein